MVLYKVYKFHFNLQISSYCHQLLEYQFNIYYNLVIFRDIK